MPVGEVKKDEELAKRTRSELSGYYNRNIVSKVTAKKIGTPTHLKIFSEKEVVDTKKLLEIWKDGKYNFHHEE